METENDGDDLKTMLVSLRDRDDPIALQELRCFSESTGLREIELIFATEEELGGRHLEADLLLFGGSGAHSVLDDRPWIKRFLDFLPLVVDEGVPAWASCFGFQGIALAMGGEVVRDDARQRLGACPVVLTPEGRIDPLFKELPDEFSAQFGHHDHVTCIPRDVTVLAQGSEGRAQAFRLEGSKFWGAQFHPELTKWSTLERWDWYRSHYEGDEGDEIDRRLREAPDTPDVQRLLRAIVKVARGEL